MVLSTGARPASEVLAAALQDHAAAVIVGEPPRAPARSSTSETGAIVKPHHAGYAPVAPHRARRGRRRQERHRLIFVPLSTSEHDSAPLSVAAGARGALRAREKRAGADLIDESPADRQLDAALALFEGGALELHGQALQ